MIRYGFPLMIITLCVVLAGPLLIEFIGGLALNVANDTASTLLELSQ